MKLGLSVFFTFCIFVRINSEKTCFNEFKVTSKDADAGKLVAIDDSTTNVKVKVMETTPENSSLYVITWNGDLKEAPYFDDDIDDNSALKYMEHKIISKNSSEISVKNSMIGAVDYDAETRDTDVNLRLYFKFSWQSESSSEPCNLLLYHNLIDENTDAPHFKSKFSKISIREDLPLDMVIPNLELFAYDFDADEPNNVFKITVNEACPLKPTEKEYVCEKGAAVPVHFSLQTHLDYDTTSRIESCKLTLTDKGISPLSDNGVLDISIEKFPDETPVFTSSYYVAELLQSLEAGTTIETDPQIFAVDKDVPSTEVTYQMTPADDAVGGDRYFKMDSSTGTVTVIKDIDEDFLSYGQVNFFLTACDEEKQCGTSFLSIKLPLQSQSKKYVYFEKMVYFADAYSPTKGSEILQVHAQSSGIQMDISYAWKENSTGIEYFSMNEVTGVVTTVKGETPAEKYSMIAMATAGKYSDHAEVNIVVLANKETMMMKENILYQSVKENTKTSLLHLEAEGADFYFYRIECSEPEEFITSFQVDNKTGELSIVKELDAELSSLVILKVAVYETEEEENKNCGGTFSRLNSNEALVSVKILDMNEYAPLFLNSAGNITKELIYAYPEEPMLQLVIGSVATVKTSDSDIMHGTPTFSLSDDSNQFIIDSKSGQIYLTSSFQCQDGCSMTVYAIDVEQESELKIQIKVLHFDQIFTMIFEDTDGSEVEERLQSISLKADMNINLLYITVMSENNKASSAKLKIQAHVYATSGSQLLEYEEFNSKLEASGTELAEKFTDRNTYEPDDHNPYRTSSIILGVFLGLALIALIAMTVRTLCCEKSFLKIRSRQISTLGRAYDNPNLTTDSHNQPTTFESIFGDQPSTERNANGATLAPGPSEHRPSAQSIISQLNFPPRRSDSSTERTSLSSSSSVDGSYKNIPNYSIHHDQSQTSEAPKITPAIYPSKEFSEPSTLPNPFRPFRGLGFRNLAKIK